ncbi:MAG: sigma-70 family RNA polymerase sigma factor, partial [Rubrivivax sp.]
MSEPSVPEDTVLISRCRAGDASAWEALVRRYQRLIYAIARRAGVSEEEAADIFQTVFMRLLQHVGHLAEPARLQAWIVTTAKREAWLVRGRSRRTVSPAAEDPPGDADDPADDAPGPDDTVAHWQLLARVQLAF